LALAALLLALGALLLLPAAAHAATVLERHIDVALRADGTVRESSHLRVRIDHEDDAASWSTHQTTLYDDRTLDRFAARVDFPDGRAVVLGPDDQETVDGVAADLFYATLRFHRARFPPLVPGAVITIDEVVALRPYFPAGRVLVRGTGPVRDLSITVGGEGGVLPDGWRWVLEGPADALTIEERDGGIAVLAEDLPGYDLLDLAPKGALQPVLRYGWGAPASWRDVGRWYHELAAAVPRGADAVRDAARQLAAGVDDPRRRLDVLAAFLQDKVANVAVLIGEGNYRPSPPADVLARKWGDCKDKAVLLVDLLAAVGVEAYPALLHKNAERRIATDFPSPDQFNHAVVAVPQDAVAVGPDDPAAGGYLFVDPTQVYGAGRWLDPDAQDQDVLVVRPEGAELVRTPLRPDLERRHLAVDLDVDENGDARGRARLEIRGELAYELLQDLTDLDPGRFGEEARSILARLLPGAELAGVAWETSTNAVPALDLVASVVLPGLVQGGEGGRSFLPPGMRATPDPRLLRDRRLPVAVPARSARTTWNLRLPVSWCPPGGDGEEVANDAGSFSQTVSFTQTTTSAAPGRLTLDRRVEVRARWVAADLLPALRDLALAEHRAHRRRIRLRCGS
jgi:transglutaminase-like putative cysteine protease